MDEDSMAKAMRRKAAVNLDHSGIKSCSKSFLPFSTPTIYAKLGTVGVSLGSSEHDVYLSSNALRHMEFDWLKCTPKVSSRQETSPLDDDEDAYATTDGQLLSHLVGEVSEVDLDDPMLRSVFDLKASGRSSKSSSAKRYSKPGKRAKMSKSMHSSK
jgi:hypothetical protein